MRSPQSLQDGLRPGGDVAAVVLAAGSGRRMGASINKALLPLAGRPVLARTLDRFESHPSVGRIVVVAAAEELEPVRRIVSGPDAAKVTAVIPGGATRHASEWNGLRALAPDIEFGVVRIVLVHDAARPFVTAGEIDRVIAAARAGGAAIPTIAVDASELRPVVQQHTNMTVGRVLYVSAHLLASSERAARLADFWQLVDLYSGLQGGGIPRLFSEKYWEETVLGALATLPGRLATLMTEHARALYQEWMNQTLGGVVPPSRVGPSGVAVPYPNGERTLSPAAFLAQHLQERRDTLHGYDLTQPVQAALLGIHNGSLPQRLPEWGRFLLIALLAEPGWIIERRFLPE